MELQENKHNVCSALMLVNLGEETPGTGGNGTVFFNSGSVPPFDIWVEQLRKLCRLHDDQIDHEYRVLDPATRWNSWQTKYLPKMGYIEVVTCSGQPVTESYLEKLGFQHLGPFTKLKHPTSQTKIWAMQGDEFCRAIGYVSKYDIRNQQEMVQSAV